MLGYLKPFSQAIYGNYKLVEALALHDRSPLDVEYSTPQQWDAVQLESYCRIVATTLESYLDAGRGDHSYALTRALDKIEHNSMDLYKLNDIASDYYSTDIYRRFRVNVKFVGTVLDLMDERQEQARVKLRIRDDDRRFHSLYDQVAKLMYTIILHSTGLTKAGDLNWSVQHNLVLSEFFHRVRKGIGTRIILFKLRRLLFDEINQLARLPNYEGSRILGFCLNVMGLKLGAKDSYSSQAYALHKAVLAWVRKHYVKLRIVHPDVAESCLMGTISYDQGSLIKTYSKGLSLKIPQDFLKLD